MEILLIILITLSMLLAVCIIGSFALCKTQKISIFISVCLKDLIYQVLSLMKNKKIHFGIFFINSSLNSRRIVVNTHGAICGYCYIYLLNSFPKHSSIFFLTSSFVFFQNPPLPRSSPFSA